MLTRKKAIDSNTSVAIYRIRLHPRLAPSYPKKFSVPSFRIFHLRKRVGATLNTRIDL